MSQRTSRRYDLRMLRALGFAASIVVALAAHAQADDGSTVAFLGSETAWREARLSLHAVHAFWRNGADVHVSGAGRVVVRRMQRDGTERRHDATIPAQEARRLLRLACEVDLIRVEVPDRPGVPDELRPFLVLSNERGGLHSLDKWSNDEVPRWDRVGEALISLARSVEESHEPCHEGPWDRGWAWASETPSIRVITYDRRRSGDTHGRGVVITSAADLAAARERLRDLPESDQPAGDEGRSFWMSASRVEAFPPGSVQVGARTVRIDGKVFQDARGLEDWLRARLRAARVVVPAGND